MEQSPAIDHTFLTLLDGHVAERPDTAFVKCGDGEWLTYAQVRDRSNAIADGMRRGGISPGDHVAVILPNCEEYLLAVFACARLGVVQVPINTSLKGDFLRYQLAHSQATALVTDSLGIGQIAGIVGELPQLGLVARVGAPEPGEPELAKQTVVDFATFEATGDPGATFDPVDPTATHAIMYTSGTTGLPKGCVISHRYATNIGRKVGAVGYVRPDDVAMTPMPLFHIGGQFVALGQCLAVGASIAIEPTFSASGLLDRCRELGITNYLGLGPMAMALLAQPPRPDDRDHQVRCGMFIPVKPDRLAEFEERFGIQILSEFYAQTEWSPVTICPAWGPRLPGSAGVPAPDVEVRIVDDDDNELPPGQVGEIVGRPARPGIMFDGYWNDPVSSLQTFRGLWHHTGDLGRLDEEGRLYYVDRKKDALRRRGELVSSQELEMAIVKHPEVAAVAVLAAPSPLGEDDIKACLVPEPGAALTPELLFDFFRAELPYFAIPRYVEVMAELPVNASHRVMKHKLREDAVNDRTWDFEALGLTVAKDQRRR
ncbi:MAG: AMP-binding protein [Acidimicrobiia bacterium]